MSEKEPQRPAPAKIRDVAARANVALSSVSRVLSGHPDVSERMREKVEAAAAELGYEPDFRGQSLRSGHTYTIGFLMRDISNPLFASIARQCEHELRLAGYLMLIVSSDGDLSVEAQNLELLRRRKVDGLIASLVSETADSTVKALQGFTVPIVLLDREVAALTDTCAVLSDHYSGVLDATRDLIARGHQHVALVTGERDVRSTRERLRAIEDAYAEAGLPFEPESHMFGSFTREFAEAQVRRLLTGSAPPTAILAGGVGPTIGALAAIKDLGLVVGDDVTVVALDEWPDFDVLAPDVSRVTRDSNETGTASAKLMLEMLSGGASRVETIGTTYHPR